MSPRVIIPERGRAGVLPFLTPATLMDRGGTVLVVGVPVTVWPGRGRPGAAGVHYTHDGEAASEYFGVLREPNRVLELDGVRYVILSAILHEFMPHVALELNRTTGARG